MIGGSGGQGAGHGTWALAQIGCSCSTCLQVRRRCICLDKTVQRFKFIHAEQAQHDYGKH